MTGYLTSDGQTASRPAIRSGLVSRGRLRRRAAGIAAGKQTATEKSAFQRPIAVHAATAKDGRFAGGIKPRHDLAVVAEYARVEVGLETAQRLAGQDVEFHGDQG